jgi:thiamine-monophosphate kinase
VKVRRGEFAAIERIRHGLAGRSPGRPWDEVWIGDDAAVVERAGGTLLLTTDLTVGGVHADLDLMGLDDLGWRALVAAVSDIAAMGGVPAHVLVAVAGPPSTDLDLLYEGIGSAAEAHGCSVVGGDLSTARELVVSVSVTGFVEDADPPVLRSGARPGDALMVTGALGASAAGLRVLRSGARGGARSGDQAALVESHVRPRAKLREGETARGAGASAMIDVSDGLAADLGHLAEASDVGFELGHVPVAPGATEAEALAGGEDYELLIATPDPARIVAAYSAAGLGAPMAIGVCTGDRARRTLRGVALEMKGFEHPWD